MKEMNFVGAVRQFFGQKQGQTLQQFGEEIKTLTPQDRADLAAMFETQGIKIVEKSA